MVNDRFILNIYKLYVTKNFGRRIVYYKLFYPLYPC